MSSKSREFLVSSRQSGCGASIHTQVSTKNPTGLVPPYQAGFPSISPAGCPPHMWPRRLPGECGKGQPSPGAQSAAPDTGRRRATCSRLRSTTISSPSMIERSSTCRRLRANSVAVIVFINAPHYVTSDSIRVYCVTALPTRTSGSIPAANARSRPSSGYKTRRRAVPGRASRRRNSRPNR